MFSQSVHYIQSNNKYYYILPQNQLSVYKETVMKETKKT
jgi:hypothetical protein